MATRRAARGGGRPLAAALFGLLVLPGRAHAQDSVPPPAALAELETNPYRGDTAMIAAGAKLYRVCAVCHGERGAGGARGPELSRTRLSDRDFFRVVMHGRTGTLMPAWRDKLSPGEVWQIHAFLVAACN
ncbi:MAG: c-type cytochrome [bacterium]